MKKTLLLILVLLMSFIGIAFPAEKSADSFEKYQLMPVDDTSKNRSLLYFINSLKVAIKKKDAEFIKDMTSDEIEWSFGDERGKESFIKEWKLDSSPKDSGIWQILEDIINLGGVYDAENAKITYPYVFVNFPEKFDAFGYVAVTGKNVNVRSKPGSKSPVLERVSYEIVRSVGGEEEREQETLNGRTCPWEKVQLSSGKTGYVFGKYVQSPVGYRASFVRTDGMWTLAFFIAGD